MNQAGTLNIESVDSSSVKATMWFEPSQARASSIWLLHLLNTQGFLERFWFKQSTQGRIRLKLQFRKRADWQQQLADIKLQVLSLTTKVES